MRQIIAIFGLLTALVLGAPPLQAQSAFKTVVQVNDSVITNFEIDQRARLLVLMRRPGVNREMALDELIDNRLQAQAAQEAGIVPTQEEIVLGIESFSSRANLSADEFLQTIAEVGIEPETIRDFIEAQLAWGDLLRTRYAARARPSEDEIDRALALGTGRGSTRVLLSEIILPLTPELAATSEERAADIANIRSIEQFSEAAQRFSVAATRNNGGRLDWMPLSELPPQIAPLFLTLEIGEVTPPVPLSGAVALFQLRGVQDAAPALNGNSKIDYIRLRLPPGTNLAAEEAKLRGRLDECGDFYGAYFGASEEQLKRETVDRSALPRNLQAAIDRLDPGELASIGPQSSADGGSIVMLCARSEIREEELTREDITRQLFQRNLETLGAALLAELRADAYIERLE